MDENNVIKKEKAPKVIIAFIILSLIALIITNGYLTYGTISAFTATGNGASLGIGVFFAVGVIIIGGIGNGISLVFAVIGLIITAVKNKQSLLKKQFITLIVLTILPIVFEIAFILIYAFN